MRDRIARPVDRDQIDRVQLAQIEGAIVIARHEVLLGAIVEVAHIVQRDEIAILRRIGQDRDLGLPVALIGRLDREPPQQHDRERGTEAEQRPAPVRQEQERAKGAQRERRSQSEPESAHRPDPSSRSRARPMRSCRQPGEQGRQCLPRAAFFGSSCHPAMLDHQAITGFAPHLRVSARRARRTSLRRGKRLRRRSCRSGAGRRRLRAGPQRPGWHVRPDHRDRRGCGVPPRRHDHARLPRAGDRPRGRDRGCPRLQVAAARAGGETGLGRRLCRRPAAGRDLHHPAAVAGSDAGSVGGAQPLHPASADRDRQL